MKTKNIIAILAALPLMAGFTGCSSDDELTAKPAKEILRVLEGGVELPARQSIIATDPVTSSVSIIADCEWEVFDKYGNKFGTNSSVGFGTKLSVTPLKGVGNGNLMVSVDQNTNVYERKDTIMLKSPGGLKQLIAIRQVSGNDDLSISDNQLVFESDDTTPQPFTVKSNVGWNIQMPLGVSWFKVVDGSGNDVAGTALAAGVHNLNVTVDPAVSDTRRTAKFFVSFGTESYPVEVVQNGVSEVTLSVMSQSDIVDGVGGEKMVWIESNAEWHAYVPSSVDWVFVEPPTGVGNGELRIFCEPNSTGGTRMTAVVIVAGSKNPKQEIVVVEQAAGSSQWYLSVWDFYSTYVGSVDAKFRFNYESSEEVYEYGLVYSTSIREPSLDNGAESVMLGHGSGTRGEVEGPLENLQPMTTYQVRAFAMGTQGIQYSPNVITITTGEQGREGTSDTPWP